MVQQMEPIRHLAGGGRPEARRFRVGLRPISHQHFDPGMRLQPMGDGTGLSIGEQGERPPGEVQQERAVRVALAQGKLVHAEHRGETITGQGAQRITRNSVFRLTGRPTD
jgi:hypothetical protein